MRNPFLQIPVFQKHSLPVLLLVCAFFTACASGSGKKEPDNNPSGGDSPVQVLPDIVPSVSNTENPRSLIERGSPDSLAQAAALFRAAPPASADQRRALSAAALVIARIVYPEISLGLPEVSGGHPYERIIRDVDRRTYTPPPSASGDFLEHILPFLALYNYVNFGPSIDPSRYQAALPHLEQAARLNGASVLPPLFRGFALEKTGNIKEAEAAYNQALTLDNSCYPAELGLARLLHAQGKYDEELTLLNGLQTRYPGSMEIRKQFARLFMAKGDAQQADGLITEILRLESRNGEFLLLRSRLLLDRGLYQQAQSTLDTLAAIDSTNRQYIFLRARHQAEGLRNRTAAINLLQTLYRSQPDNGEIAVYLASLLLESSRAEDTAEGRILLARLLESSPAMPEVLALAAADSIRGEKWGEAKTYLDRLLTGRRERKDLLNAWKVERALGNLAAALSHARELYNRNQPSDEEAAAYVTSLIDTGRQAEAGKIINERIATVPSGTDKSQYYYLRSRLRTNEEAVLNDLRSALFEDPRNLDALITIFEIYHRKKDERRAVYYLKQALAIAPNNPQLSRYKTEYAALLGN
ncbi:MAG: tetratricopeptide repeat protein [Spirochaetaceae bacterium]|nr:tetratricopeptide repeat protein [Spirochaetaceae bacterium]